jgi:uncharacterized protein (TIGR00725 family)
MITVSVIGDGSCSAETARLAEDVGRLLAEKGAALVCGGLGGVMEAACRGAKSAGGLTIGILPGRTRRDANPYVDIPIVTGMGEARNVIVVSSGQSVIAVSGGYGTLSEIAHALKLRIPVVGLGSWRLSKEGWDHPLKMNHATDAADAVEKALALAAE